eukprot:8774565-Alexandrium_andersonii.AAC.1
MFQGLQGKSWDDEEQQAEVPVMLTMWGVGSAASKLLYLLEEPARCSVVKAWAPTMEILKFA